MITDKITNKTVLKIPEYRPNGLKNAVDLFEAEASKFQDAKFMVYWDPDIDGLFAGYIVEEFLKLLGLYNKNFKYKLNEKRKHGFFIKDSELASLKGYTIIAVDFSITKAFADSVCENIENDIFRFVNIKGNRPYRNYYNPKDEANKSEI